MENESYEFANHFALIACFISYKEVDAMRKVIK
jgi:hypothetical protein